MKRIARYIYSSAFALAVLCSCDATDTPTVSLGIEDFYRMQRMQSYRFMPGYTGYEYRWYMTLPDGRDSLMSTDRFFTFIQKDEGIYDLTFEIVDSQTPYKHNFQVEVVHEDVEYSAYISKVFEYKPAPGQFINEMPKYEAGDTEESMRKKVEENISGKNKVMVSLGGYGGYITFGFDHTVMNVSGEMDFAIYGNAFYELIDPEKRGGSCEPGIVMVAFDKNKNGKADEDEWFELAGSEYYKPETVRDYEVTFTRPDPNKIPIPDETGNITDTKYIHWKDNKGTEGYMPKIQFHSQDYYPKWIKEDKLTFNGSRLRNNGVDISGMGSYWVLYSFDWGYADDHPNDSISLISFDIDWAVDKNGEKIKLPGVDFIRVYTSQNQYCGWLGETSTEITMAKDWHIYDPQDTIPDPLPNNILNKRIATNRNY